jgi:hypothetical protein
MKHFILLVLFFASFAAKADWVRGSITYNDGRKTKGYVKEFHNANASYVEFKSKIKDSSEKVLSVEIKEVEMKQRDGTLIIKYVLTNTINLAGDYKIANSGIWLRLLFRGEFDVLGNFAQFLNAPEYYINWSDDNIATMIYIREKNGSIITGRKELLVKSVSAIFTNRCDEMVDAVNSQTFVPYSIHDVMKFYVESCRTQPELQAVTK